MPDYCHVFGEKVAQGLGLGRLSGPTYGTLEEYERDPAEAFSRLAESFQTSGGAVPLPFANNLTDSEFHVCSPSIHPKE